MVQHSVHVWRATTWSYGITWVLESSGEKPKLSRTPVEVLGVLLTFNISRFTLFVFHLNVVYILKFWFESVCKMFGNDPKSLSECLKSDHIVGTPESAGTGQRAPEALGWAVAQPQHHWENRSYLMLTHWLSKQKCGRLLLLEHTRGHFST